MGSLIVGIIIGVFFTSQYALHQRERVRYQKRVNKSLLHDVEFYRKLSEQYEEELERKQ
jgi:hypothetical protein